MIESNITNMVRSNFILRYIRTRAQEQRGNVVHHPTLNERQGDGVVSPHYIYSLGVLDKRQRIIAATKIILTVNHINSMAHEILTFKLFPWSRCKPLHCHGCPCAITTVKYRR